MDFVTAWKASSIVLTGAFGVLGLVKEFKNKETNKITKWGALSLSGIVVSTLLGVVAQFKEASSEERAKEETAKQTLALAEKSDQAITSLQRLLSPIDDATFGIQLNMSCAKKQFRQLCGAKKPSIIAQSGNLMLTPWPFGINHFINYEVDIFLLPSFAQAYFEGTINRGDMKVILSTDDVDKNGTYITTLVKEDNAVEAFAPDLKPGYMSNDGNIESFLDLPGTTVVISAAEDLFGTASLGQFSIKSKNGETISSKGPFEKLRRNGLTMYRFQLPKT